MITKTISIKMKFSNIASTFLLLVATGEFATQDDILVSAKAVVGNSSHKSLRAAVVKEGQRRFLEENYEEDNENANDDGQGNDDANYNEDDNSSFSYDTGYITATQCNSYKVEAEEDNMVDMVLKWNQAYGNWLEVFHVPQKSFVLFDYVNHYNKTQSTQSTTNNDIQKESSFVTDLDAWIKLGAQIGLKKQDYPACTLIDDPATLFQSNGNKNDDIAKFLNTASLANNNYFDGWSPQLYLGPMCGMGDGELNWGIFLDDTCTTYVPKWTYRYRNLAAQGRVPYDNNAKTLTTLGKYTKLNGKHWSCQNGDGFCDAILSYSADTVNCEVPGKENDEEDRRKLEQYASDDSVTDDYFANGYQLSQDNLEDIESSCGNIITAYTSGEGDLTGYLEHHGQLQYTKNYKKGERSIVEFTVLTILLFAVVVGATMVFRRRRLRVQQVPPANTKDDIEKEKMQSQTKATIEQEKDTKTTSKAKKANNSAGMKSKTKTRKQGGWFGSSRKKNCDSKLKRLLEVEIEV